MNPPCLQMPAAGVKQWERAIALTSCLWASHMQLVGCWEKQVAGLDRFLV